MQKKKEIKEQETESVRIKTSVVNLVRLNKKNTGLPIARFIEISIQEKIKRDAKES